ncbi:MAG: metallophosphoesterase family protein [Thermodesulfobacteriota bacterium]
MRIGVISDTHMRALSEDFLGAVKVLFEGVEKVIHCGDYVALGVLEGLRAEGWDVMGVAGNMDDEEIQRSLPMSRTVRLGGITIGVIHGWGSAQGLEKRVAGSFDGVDGVIFGHSHRPHWGHWGDVWLFNPGTACGWGSPSGATVGILEIGERVTGTVLPLKVRGA